MSELQRRIVRRLRVYPSGCYAAGPHLAHWVGVSVKTVAYHAAKLQARGVVESNKGPGGGYTLTDEGRQQTRML